MLIVSHRCLGFNASENSLTAFRAALNSTVDQIELDLRLTSDKQYVALHLPWFNSRHYMPQFISRTSIQEAREVGILTLQEIIEVYQNTSRRKMLRLEVKSPGQERELVQIIERSGLVDSICIASWSLQILHRCAEVNSSLQFSYSFIEGFPSAARLREILKINPHIRSVCMVPLWSRFIPEYLSSYAIPGCQLFIVESRVHLDLDLLKMRGVSGIFTKNPLDLTNGSQVATR